MATGLGDKKSEFRPAEVCLKIDLVSHSAHARIGFGLIGFYGISTFVGYLMLNPLYTYIQGSLNKFPDFFRMGTFIDTHMKL